MILPGIVRSHRAARNATSCGCRPEVSEDGEALFSAVCERELEGIVAKRIDGVYRPGERGWIKTKNRSYWRYELERESAISARRQRAFV